MTGSFSLVVDFTLNKKRTIFKKDVPFRLNDNKWHSVYFEFNVIEATVTVDGDSGRVWRTEGWTPKYDFRTKKPLVVGKASTNYTAACLTPEMSLSPFDPFASIILFP